MSSITLWLSSSDISINFSLDIQLNLCERSSYLRLEVGSFLFHSLIIFLLEKLVLRFILQVRYQIALFQMSIERISIIICYFDDTQNGFGCEECDQISHNCFKSLFVKYVVRDSEIQSEAGRSSEEAVVEKRNVGVHKLESEVQHDKTVLHSAPVSLTFK